jgi:DNA-binding transcriptional LysR family regulator
MVNIASVNLNLLVALDALLAERHVTRAARRIGITQSAMSNALARLRVLFDDPLFLRSPRGIVPTPRALALGPLVRDGLSRLETALGEPAFDPETEERTFVIAASDFVQLVVLPRLLARVGRLAPRVRLEIRAWGRHVVPAELAGGEVDVALGYFDRVPAQHRHHVLFEEPYAVIVRRGHPLVGKKLTAKTWAAIPHVVVGEERGPTQVDRALARVGLERTVALRVPQFLVVPAIVAASDLSAAIDRRVALAANLPLRIFEPPVPLPRGRVAMVWHERTARDPALAWLHTSIERSCDSLGA